MVTITPHRLVKSGALEAEATTAFQELLNAYEVLFDPKERAWYDSHRNQILFSSTPAASAASVPDLFSFFSNSVYSGYTNSGRGFYKVYGDLFVKIYASELNFSKKSGLLLPKQAPALGNMERFVTVLDFVWVNKHDVMAGFNRKARRFMADENKKLRKKARREYNETVRGLAEFVKKRDKKEPEWAKVEEVDDDYEAEGIVVVEEKKKDELYCVACSEKFKSDKQWKNHEQSKKHKEKVAELREAFNEEDKDYEATGKDVGDGNGVGYLSEAYDGVNELEQQPEGSVGIQGGESGDGETEINELADINNYSGGSGELGSDNDEASVLEAMLSGREKIQVEIDSDELEFMEYNDTKVSRRNRGGRRRMRGRGLEEAETMKAGEAKRNGNEDEHDGCDDDAGESSSNPFMEYNDTEEQRKQEAKEWSRARITRDNES
ncbi:hypothetical protein BUALT_Bualt02G0158600 [Buddleja alternifolia]|uniref:C2H2-type domain-containing protein n=1 Tax=Buddleja alternifolia TaxID=168488 RepID=A0AAV6Y231_9LAMI|nr:hypothetical protein BUALT_Bualt02G0158600 [Buddleja alternifolia]